MELLNNLHPTLQIFWIIAIPSSIIFCIQIICILININSIKHINSKNYSPNSQKKLCQFFTFNNLINFLTSFSWAGITFYSNFSNKLLVIILSILFGIGFIIIFFVNIKSH